MSRRRSRPGTLAPALLLLVCGMLLPTMVWATAAAPEAPVLLRRAVVAVICLLAGFALCLRGWDRFERRQRWRGLGFSACGWLLGVGALSLLRLSENPQTWTWWI